MSLPEQYERDADSDPFYDITNCAGCGADYYGNKQVCPCCKHPREVSA